MRNIDFKKLKLKEIYKWPLQMQCVAGIFLSVVLLICGIFFIVLDQYGDLQVAKEKEEKLKLDYIDKTKQSVNLVLYKQQLVEITQASDALLKQLPNRSEVEKLLIDINQSGIGRGLYFELFKPSPEKMTEYYAELPISLKVTGTYDAIGNFASDVSQLSRVVILKNVNLIPNANGTINLTGVAQTFRYLDQEEIDKQKSDKKAQMKKKKGENK